MRVLFAILFTGCMITGWTQDKVQLKDGKVFRGKILEYSSGKQLVFQTDEGARLELDVNELEKWQFGKSIGEQKEKGYFNNTMVGLLFGMDRWGDPNANASFQMINGYMFSKRLQAGVGIGMEGIQDNLYFPLFLDTRIYFKKGNFSPFIGLQGGYNFYDFSSGNDRRQRNDYWIWPHNQTNKRDGGIMTGLQFGVRNYTAKDVGYTFSLGYRFQKFTSEFGSGGWNEPVYPVTEKEYLHRMDIKFGLFFN